MLSVIIPAYNEEENIAPAARAIGAVLRDAEISYELLFVNDGSLDGSLEIVSRLAEKYQQVKVIGLSRNFGHEAAMIAGIDYAKGDGIVCMDADLQHPPSCLPEIVKRFEEGCGVVTMVRTRNESAGMVKNITSSGFYWVINTLSDVKFEANASDFFAVSRQAADVLRGNYREKVRFLRGYVQTIGFKRAAIRYEAQERAAGQSKYSIRRLLNFSVNTILCFSNLPLKLGIYAGGMAACLGVAVMIYTLCTRRGAPSGYATIVILNCFMFAVLFLIVGCTAGRT